jgi:hypothetical protein
VYGLESGRICVAALNAANIDYVADSIAQVAVERSSKKSAPQEI